MERSPVMDLGQLEKQIAQITATHGCSLYGFADLEGITPGKLAELSPPDVANPSDNLKNLFEMPVLFYVLCLYLFITASVDTAHVISAWTWGAFRYGQRRRASGHTARTARPRKRVCCSSCVAG